MSVSYLFDYHETLLKEQLILRPGWEHDSIGDSDLFKFQEAIDWLVSEGSPNIKIEFFSPGGCGKTGIAIHDLLCEYSGKITGVVKDKCESAAMLILQACDKRISYSSAQFLVHTVRSSMIALSDFDEEFRIAEHAKHDFQKSLELNDRYLEVVLGNSLLDKDTLISLMNEDKKITSKTALEYGFIDEIFSPVKKRKKKKKKSKK